MFSQSVLCYLSLVAGVSAHQNFHQFWVNGVSPGYQVGLRMPPSNSPVVDVTSDDMACNVNGSVVPSGVETVAASEGDEITVGWDPSGHPGPITHFLFGPVDDASQTTGIGAGWFKIDELDYVDGKWANEVIQADGGNYTFKLPTGLASGEYLLRSEMLALHAANTVGGAQFYIGCAQLKITGTGSGCNPTISLPGAYNAEDSDIYIPDVYNGFDPTTYTAPGGSVATCGAGSGSASSTSNSTAKATKAAASSSISFSAPLPTGGASNSTFSGTAPSQQTTAAPSSQNTVQPTTLVTFTSATSDSAATPSSGTDTCTDSGSVALYGQCGGTGYTGATTCAEGTCVKQNNYYSQCVSSA